MIDLDVKVFHLQGLEAAETAKAMSNMVPMMIFLSDGKVFSFFLHFAHVWVMKHENMVPMMIFLCDGKVSFFFSHFNSAYNTWVFANTMNAEDKYSTAKGINKGIGDAGSTADFRML